MVGRLAICVALAGCDVVFGTDFDPGVTVDADVSGCLRDTFEDGELDRFKWSVTDTAITIDERDGQLVFTAAAGVDTTSAVFSVGRFDVTGGQLVAEVVAPATGGSMGISLLNDLQTAYSIHATSTAITFSMITPTPPPPVEIPYDATQMRYWRMLHLTTTNEVNFDTSADGLGWVNQHREAAQVPLTFMIVVMGLQATAPERPIEGRLDNVQLATRTCPLL